jgi:hypothetical protein
MITTVASYHHWSPSVIGDLFCDKRDLHGLEFWYDHALAVAKKLKK